MGADIHAVVQRVITFEKRDGAAGKMALFEAEFRLARNYGLFSLMAGVRQHQDFPPLYGERGLPSELCYKAKEFDNPGYHTPSYMDADELEKVKKKYEATPQWINAYSQYSEQAPTRESVLADPMMSPRDYPENVEVHIKEFHEPFMREGRRAWQVRVGPQRTYKWPSEYEGLLAYMRALEGGEDGEIQLVFCFDS